MENIQTVTIFRNWVDIAEALKSDAERGKLYHAICIYSLTGTEPDLEGHLKAFFTLMRPSIDKSNKRKSAQQKSLQKRLQNSLQNDLQNNTQNDLQNSLQKRLQNSLQNDLQNNTQNDLQNSLQNDSTRARKKEKGNIKKTVTKVTAKENVSFDSLIPPHLISDDFRKKWHQWLDFRREKRKPVSDQAARMQLDMLSQLSESEAIASIDNSIANDYQGLFPPKHKQPATPGKDYTSI